MELYKEGEWLRFPINSSWEGTTIDYILKVKWHTPKKLLHQLRMEKGVRINGMPIPWSTQLHLGDIFEIRLLKKEDYGVIPNQLNISVLYEDDHVLIANKPPQMDTHPSNASQKDTLANGVAFHLLQKGIETKVRHIHRLDKDTTGAVLFGKHALSAAILDRMLDQRMIKRTYLALVHGNFKNKSGIIREPIGRDRHHPTKRRVSKTGQEAITMYEVVHYDIKRHQSLMKLQLQTGRTHQIRVHMNYIGHAIVGDKLYGNKGDKISRQALHAARIEFPHPLTGDYCTTIAPFMDNPPIFSHDMLKELKNS